MAVDATEFETLVDESVRLVAGPESEVPETRVLSGPRSKTVALVDKLSLIAAREGFEVESLLGKGGMGAVLLARDRALSRMVALKFLAIPEETDPKALDALRKEAERASTLAHENVVQVYSWHSVGKLTFFVMEFVDGDDLQQYVQREFRLTVEELLRILAEASAGVAAAHASGVVHRDIKPQNILIARTGRVKVADFGLSASPLEERARRRGEISGTLGFMAPEQARGEPATFTSDVYSLAATLYYAFARVSPYGPYTNMQLMLARNQGGDHIPLSQAKPGLPPVIYQVVEKGLSPEPQRRFHDANAFRKALEEALLRLHSPEPKRKPRPKANLQAPWMVPAALGVGVLAGIGIGILATIAFLMW